MKRFRCTRFSLLISAIVGLNLEFINGFSMNAEVGFGDDSERYVLSGTLRF